MKSGMIRFGLIGMILYGSSAKADNIVLNPGFELGLTSWHLNTINPNQDQWGIGSIAHGGLSDIETLCGTPNPACMDTVSGSYFYQDLPTVAGRAYDLSFWAYFDGPPNELKVTWNGSTALDILSVVPLVSYAQYSVFGLLATSNTTRLQFNGREDGGLSVGVDDISVTPNPEPSTLLLISAGLLIFAGVHSRSRSVRVRTPSS